MSVKLLVLYPTPTDSEEFDKRYEREHLPMGKANLIGATSPRVASHSRVALGQVPVRSTDGGHISFIEGPTGVRGSARSPEDDGQRGRDLDWRRPSLHDCGTGRLSLTR